MKETWKSVVGYVGFYEVSSTGRVRSVTRVLRDGRMWRGRIRPHHILMGGYQAVTLCVNGKQQNKMIHRMVAEAFLGPPPDGMECCHNDGVKANNSIENLRWDTSKNNHRDRIKHGGQARGSKHHSAKICELDAWLIRESSLPGAEFARFFDISQATVSNIRRGKSWVADKAHT